MRTDSVLRTGALRLTGLACSLAAGLGLAAAVAGQTPTPPEPPKPEYLPREAAVHYALQNNPALMTVRQQRGYAEAAVVIAKTYPFNPVFTGVVAQNSGPESAGVTNSVFNEHYVVLELELRGQGRHRRAAAAAGASRVEWEIAQQELAVSVAVLRAYNAVLYRQKKLENLEETIKLDEQAVESIRRLVGGRLKPIDELLARSELDTARAQRGPAATALAIARAELRRQLGTLDDEFKVFGDLGVSLPPLDATALTQLALELRPDLHARQAALGEAEAGLKLVEANRYGNPSLGPFYELDSTRTSITGARMVVPLPVLNTHRGEILRAQTDVARVQSEINQLGLQASQEVQAALARLADARKWAEVNEKEVVPNLLKARQQAERLFESNDASVDLVRLISVQRSYIRAIDTLLDARYEVSQAQADLALAVAEPTLALGLPPQAPACAAPATLP